VTVKGRPSGSAAASRQGAPTARDGTTIPGPTSLIEYQHAPGAAGPTLAIGTATIIVGPGQSAVVPRGVVHQPSNTSGRPVRFLFLNSPPMDQFFVRLGALAADAHGQPPADKLRDLGEQHDAIFTDLPAAGPFSMYNEGP
jgi:Cupin domain